MAQDGIGMAIRPAHTMGDGDVVFALATGRGLKSRRQPNVTAVGALAAEMLALAITRGVSEATSLADVPAVRDLE
ncbi:P1 family peptidase, partial [Dehalococcoidia bacterium]|nr:P1 family peptidase [Dehalococcoidia bacterium]